MLQVLGGYSCDRGIRTGLRGAEEVADREMGEAEIGGETLALGAFSDTGAAYGEC